VQPGMGLRGGGAGAGKQAGLAACQVHQDELERETCCCCLAEAAAALVAGLPRLQLQSRHKGRCDDTPAQLVGDLLKGGALLAVQGPRQPDKADCGVAAVCVELAACLAQGTLQHLLR
jgi:hypothetical protein